MEISRDFFDRYINQFAIFSVIAGFICIIYLVYTSGFNLSASVATVIAIIITARNWAYFYSLDRKELSGKQSMYVALVPWTILVWCFIFFAIKVAELESWTGVQWQIGNSGLPTTFLVMTLSGVLFGIVNVWLPRHFRNQNLRKRKRSSESRAQMLDGLRDQYYKLIGVSTPLVDNISAEKLIEIRSLEICAIRAIDELESKNERGLGFDALLLTLTSIPVAVVAEVAGNLAVKYL